MIGVVWYFRRALVVLLGVGIALSYVWPATERDRLAARFAADMCAHPGTCASAPPAAVPPILQTLAGDLPAGPGVVYSKVQLEGALVAAAVAEPSAHVGAAVAEAESGGRSDAVCDSCAGVRELSVGPWQENLLAHPWLSRACAMALECAARAAATISGRGADWSAWTTYRDGAWRAYA